MNSIHRRLTARLLCTLGVITAAVGVALFVGVRIALIKQFDATLEARLASLESAARWDGHRVDLDFVPDAMPWYRPGPDAEYFTVATVTESGGRAQAVGRSPSLGSGELEMPAALREGIADIRLPDGREGRVATRLIAPLPEEELDLPGKEQERRSAIQSTPQVRVTVAMGRRRLDATLATVGVSLVLAGGALGLGLVLATRHALRGGLAPLDAFSKSIQEVQPEALSQRVPGEHLPEELRSIHTRLNDLIERLDIAFQRERRFASAAAHELRTPVAELRSLLEVAVSRPRDAGEAREAMSEALIITLRMNRLIGALLALARTGAAPETEELESVNIRLTLAQVARRHQNAAESRGGAIRVEGNNTATVRADPATLESILTNVISNAVDHAEPAAHVRCEVSEAEGGTVQVDVVNPASSVKVDDLERFFEPFWRGSESRTDPSHLGLGLAVSRALARGMGGDVTAFLDGGDVRVRVLLKAAGSAPLRPGKATIDESGAEPSRSSSQTSSALT